MQYCRGLQQHILFINMIHVYGIPNCDTVKKARTWLDAQSIPYTFHNFKTEPPSKVLLLDWCKQAGWEKLLNKQSSTWRALDDDEKATATNAKKAVAIMMKNYSIIKRPVITDTHGMVLAIGFNIATMESLALA